MRDELVLCTFSDGSSLVRFIAEDEEELWSGRIERELNTKKSMKERGVSAKFYFRTGRHHSPRLFLFNPIGGVDAALEIEIVDSNEASFEVVYPGRGETPPPHVAMQLWGLFLALRTIPSVEQYTARRGDTDRMVEGHSFENFCLPWLEKIPMVEPADWRVERWFTEKCRLGYVTDYSGSLLGRKIDISERVTGNTTRVRNSYFEVRRRPRTRMEMGAEYRWSVDNFVVGLRSVEQEDLASAIVRAGVAFWDAEELLKFVENNASKPSFSESLGLELVLGLLPSAFVLPRKELLGVYGDGS